MKRLLAGLAGLALPFAAWAFPIDVEVQSEGVSIVASSSYLSNIATVTLLNEGPENALCEARFVNGPERPVPRRVRLNPGEQTILTQAFQRHINRVRITLSCEPG